MIVADSLTEYPNKAGNQDNNDDKHSDYQRIELIVEQNLSTISETMQRHGHLFI
jgi:hypothetical protein